MQVIKNGINQKSFTTACPKCRSFLEFTKEDVTFTPKEGRVCKDGYIVCPVCKNNIATSMYPDGYFETACVSCEHCKTSSKEWPCRLCMGRLHFNYSPKQEVL